MQPKLLPNRIPPKPDSSRGSAMRLLYAPRYVLHEERAGFFEGFCYLTRLRKVYCSDGIVRGRAAFCGMYGNREFYDSAGKKIPNPWLAYVLAPDFQRAEAYDLGALRIEIEERLWEVSAADELQDDLIDELEEELRRVRLAIAEGHAL